MISATEDRAVIERCYSLGITDYIRRPFDSFIVQRRVKNTLTLYANQKRLMGFQVIHALQVGRQNTDDQIPRLNRRGSEYIRHIGTAVQDDEIHQLRGVDWSTMAYLTSG